MFTQRVVSSVLVPQDVYQKKPQVVLENVAAHNMVGLLKQVGQLSEYAADVLKNLFDESSQTFTRIKSIGARVEYMETAVPQVESVFQSHDPAFFYAAGKSGKEWRNRDLYTQSLFSPKTQPTPVQARRAACQAPPSVHLLDQIANKNCLLEYSNPALFFEMWFREEEERQKKLREENKKKKKKKKARVQSTKPREVEAIQLKVFSGKGKEFDTPGQSASSSTIGTEQTPKKQSRIVTEEVDDEEEDVHTATATSVQRPTYVYSTPSKSTLGVSTRTLQQPPTTGTSDAYFTGGTSREYYEQPQAQPQVQPLQPRTVPPVPTFDGSVPTPPPMGDTPMMPVPPSMQRPSPPTSGMPTPPMMAQSRPPPPVEEAPPEAPPMDDAPEAPPMDDAPEAPPDSGAPLILGGGGGGGRGGGPPPRPGGLLSEIQGKQLRKAAPKAAPLPPSGRDGLLGEIRNRNFQLKKVEVKDKKEDKGSYPTGGGLGSVMAILSRRSAISGSSDEEEEPKGGVVTSASASSKKDDDDDDEEENWDP